MFHGRRDSVMPNPTKDMQQRQSKHRNMHMKSACIHDFDGLTVCVVVQM